MSGKEYIEIEHWPFIAAFSTLAGAQLFWLIRHRRGLTGSIDLCPTCNYDLRATPARCPECGRATSGITAPNVSG